MEKLKNLLATLDLKELKKAKNLVNSYYQQKKKEEAKNILIKSYTNSAGVYFRLERVFCNKGSCSKCNGPNSQGHGPYWYSYHRGKRSYLGKKSYEELDKIKQFSNMVIKTDNAHKAFKA